MGKSISSFLIYLTVFTFIIIFPTRSEAQILVPDGVVENTDSIRKTMDIGPFFGLYKDNYFAVGTDPFHKPTGLNSGVKFQLSISQRLTNATLPWGTYLYLFFTEKVFWEVFKDSMPMSDLNFNPGIGWSKPFFVKDRYCGKLTLIVEHESNGRDGEASRSWNKVSLAGSAFVTECLSVHAKYWIPIVDGKYNQDLLKYSGIFQMGFQLNSLDHKFTLAATFVKRQGWNFNWNTNIQLGWRIHKDSNQYFFADFYNGYGEGLLDYNQFHNRLRIGILIRPKFFSEY
ncbi:MAG: phospholipase A [Muribaculaceae bacterium]|nr:phospholipase A [Muribaculaceae bacterium]MDE7095884.1 phospholipase A [Muribaculaceae bacterium]